MSGKSSPKEQELTGWAAFSNYIWNSRTNEFMGRTGTSWAKIILFYIVFYAFLAAFWALMLYIFLETINNERPKWTLDESRIGTNPGLGFRPNPATIDSTLIEFNLSEKKTINSLKSDLDQFLTNYRSAYNKSLPECRRAPIRKAGCSFLVNLNDNPCGPNYGYDSGSPCVLVKLNRIFDWKPQPFKSVSELQNAKNPDEDENFKRNDIRVNKPSDLVNGEGLIVLSCKGESQTDEENIGSIQYWPFQGFPAEYYPFTNQKGYLSPFVFVKFNNPKKDVLINVECTAHAQNIAIKKNDREGLLHFELKIKS